MKAKNRKQEILEAAVKIFALKGFSQTSMQDIAKKVGVKKASLYYFFKGKEQIYASIVLDILNDIENLLNTHLKKNRFTNQGLSDLILEIVQECQKKGIVVRIVDIPKNSMNNGAAQKIKTSIINVKKITRKILKRYEVENESLAAEVVINAIHSYVIHANRGIRLTSPKNYSKYLASMLLKK